MQAMGDRELNQVRLGSKLKGMPLLRQYRASSREDGRPQQALEHCCGRLGGKEPPLIGSSEVRPDDVERLPAEGLDINEMMAMPLL